MSDFQGNQNGPRDNSKRNVVPVTIKQLKSATLQSGAVLIGDREVHQVSLVGFIVSFNPLSNGFSYSFEDSTDVLENIQYLVDGDNLDNIVQKDYVYAKFILQVRAISDQIHFSIVNIRPLTDFNEITFSLLDALASHKSRQLSHQGSTSQSNSNYNTNTNTFQQTNTHNASHNNASTTSGPTSNPQFNKVLATIQASALNNDHGVGVNDVRAKTGLTMDVVRAAISALTEEGYLYSTVDDEHFLPTDM